MATTRAAERAERVDPDAVARVGLGAMLLLVAVLDQNDIYQRR